MKFADGTVYTPNNECPHCKNNMKFYDGCLGYEAIVCTHCGYFEDHTTTGFDDGYINTPPRREQNV